MRKPIIAGNWKMHKTISEAKEFARVIKSATLNQGVDAVICPPFTVVQELVNAFKESGVQVGTQNMHQDDKGAFTGEVSAQMLVELGTKYVIIGHSERRQYFAETDVNVNLKVKKALEFNLMPIVCVGETLLQREDGVTNKIIQEQVILALQGVESVDIPKIVIAYEPIWAIGTGKTATSSQANDVCKWIRKIINDQYGEMASSQIRIQYGGSVKESNIKEIMEQSDIDGALVGGASLKAEDFIQLINY